MTLVDHNHKHSWEQIGLISERGQVEIVYQCAECDAWSTRELSDTSRVKFHRGTIDDGERNDSAFVRQSVIDGARENQGFCSSGAFCALYREDGSVDVYRFEEKVHATGENDG